MNLVYLAYYIYIYICPIMLMVMLMVDGAGMPVTTYFLLLIII